MSKIKQLPSLLSDALSLENVNLLARALDLDPDDDFGPNDNKSTRLQKIHQFAKGRESRFI